MGKELKVFLDTSVLITSILNNEGASRIIIDLGKKDLIKLFLTPKVVQEARNNLLKKYNKDKVLDLYRVISNLKKDIHPSPKTHDENKYINLIDDPKDCHILASAEKYQVGYLLTFDRRHFFTDKIKNAQLSFKIMLPGDFLKIFRNKKL